MKLLASVIISFFFVISLVSGLSQDVTCGDSICASSFEIAKGESIELIIDGSSQTLKLSNVNSGTAATLQVGNSFVQIYESQTHKIGSNSYYIEYVYHQSLDGKNAVRMVLTNEFTGCSEDCASYYIEVMCGDGVCNREVTFDNGQTVQIFEDGKHTLTVEDVASSSAEFRVDGRTKIMAEGESWGIKGLDFKLASINSGQVVLLLGDENDATCAIDCTGTPEEPECVSESEICDDGIDNDCDSFVDEDDSDCAPEEIECAAEGEQFSKVFTEYPENCCEGLIEWESGMDTREVVDGECVETGLLAGSPVGTCINCGNGVCESIEDVCNCPEDCEANEPGIPDQVEIELDNLEINQLTLEIITDIESIKNNLPLTQKRQVTNIEIGIIDVTEDLDAYLAEMNSRNILYLLSWFFGAQEKQELADIDFLVGHTDLLSNHKVALVTVANQLPDSDVKTQLLEQANKLEKQINNLISTIDAKERSPRGWFSR
ncbi:MAG: hypothetical protein KKC05_04190 [Nanoarchaeota archaeon]|nr:hypothetical protein [Nanoarchaeota archaeon]